MTPVEERRSKLRQLSRDSFDVLVVGGGINGAGIAREAALRGLRTALVDKGDFAWGTSSRSSKLIHGGVRYLETGNVRLVLESSGERDRLRRRLAPHLVRPLPFVFPVFRGSRVPLWKLRLGMIAYDLLAAFRNIERHRILGPSELAAVEPALAREGLIGGALYYDCWTDDARLVLETVLSAEEAGAVCLNYVAVTGFRREGGRLTGARARDEESGEGEVSIAARVVVNATGPWLDRIRHLEDATAAPRLRPTKGSHVIVDRARLPVEHAIVMHAARDDRVLFAIPWEDRCILGTTDTDYAGDPDSVAVEDEDVRYLIETARRYFPAADLREADVISGYAGLRPLLASEEGAPPSALSREEEILESRAGLVSIGGGKLTTYRLVAVKVVDRVARTLAREHGVRSARRSGTEWKPLPGAGSKSVATHQSQRSALADVLGRRYGTRADRIEQEIELDDALSRTVAEEGPHYAAELVSAARNEHALRLDDALRRRTSIALRRADGGAGMAEDAGRLMGAVLGWNEEVQAEHVSEYRRRTAPSWRGHHS